MEKRKRILVVNGEQAEESLEVGEYLREHLEEWEVYVDIVKCQADEIEPAMRSYEPDVLVTMVQMERDYGMPVFPGEPFLTGEGEEELVEEILSALGEYPEE